MDNIYIRDIDSAFANYQNQVSRDTDNIMYMCSDREKNLDFFKHSLTRESISIPSGVK